MPSVKKTQNNFTSGILSPGVWARTDLQKYQSGCRDILNGLVQCQGGVAKRPGTRFVSELMNPQGSFARSGETALIPFTYSVDQTYILCIYGDNSPSLDLYMDVFADGGRVRGNIRTPYARLRGPASTRYFRWVQSADVLFLVHPDYPPYRLERRSHTDWVFVEMAFAPSVPAPGGVTATGSGFKNGVDISIYYKVSAVDGKGEESPVSVSAEARVKSVWEAGAYISLTWSPVPGAVRYQVYKNDSGFYAWAGSAESTSFTDRNIKPDAARSPKEFRNPFSGPGKYPGAVGIVQQRLVFGRTDEEPQTIWASEVGDYGSMAVSEPIRKDNAITITLDSLQMNEIKHLVPLRDMIVLTGGAEFKMESGETSGAISPTTVHFPVQSYWGSSDVVPQVVGTSVLMVQNGGKVLRDIHYTFAEDGYSGVDLSILAEHLFTSPIKCITYQQIPNSTLWVVLEDGRLLALAYMREHEVWAWSRMDIGGKVLAAACIREEGLDRLYLVVERPGRAPYVETIDGVDYAKGIGDAFYVDSGLSYEGPEVSRITGLGHLAGNTVSVLADGVDLGLKEVASDGSVELGRKAKKVHAGLPYEFRMETLDPDIQTGMGEGTQGLVMNVPRVVLYLRNSLGLHAGPDWDHLVEVKFPGQKVWDGAIAPYNGEIATVIPGSNRRTASLCFRQDSPYPLTIEAVTEWVTLGG